MINITSKSIFLTSVSPFGDIIGTASNRIKSSVSITYPLFNWTDDYFEAKYPDYASFDYITVLLYVPLVRSSSTSFIS